MIDTHTHLTSAEIQPAYKEAINEFIDVGGKALLNVGYEPESNLAAISMSREFTHPNFDLYTSIGLHPDLCNPNSFNDFRIKSYSQAQSCLRDFESLFNLHKDNLCAVGECGLDYYHIYNDDSLSNDQREECIEIQKLLFRKMLQIALGLDKPLTIHTRELTDSTRCIEDALSLVAEVGGGRLSGSFHSYSGDPQYGADITALGFGIGFNAIITYKNADNVREILRSTQPDRILIETDAPYLIPRTLRDDKINPTKFSKPAHIVHVVSQMSEILGKSTDYLIEQSSENFKALFCIDS